MLLRAVKRFPAPVIAMVHGSVWEVRSTSYARATSPSPTRRGRSQSHPQSWGFHRPEWLPELHEPRSAWDREGDVLHRGSDLGGTGAAGGNRQRSDPRGRVGAAHLRDGADDRVPLHGRVAPPSRLCTNCATRWRSARTHTRGSTAFAVTPISELSITSASRPSSRSAHRTSKPRAPAQPEEAAKTATLLDVELSATAVWSAKRMTVSWAELSLSAGYRRREALVGTAEPLLATLPGVWREIAAGNLRRRPPERVPVHLSRYPARR